MDKIRVLHISPLLTIGGAEKKLLYILKKLDRHKFSHSVIYSIAGDLREEIDKEGIPLVKVHPMSLVNPLSLISIQRIYQYIKRNKIDLVHCHLDVAFVLGSISATMAGVPVLFSFQNIADERYLRYYYAFKHIERFLSLFTDRIIAESRAVLDVLLSWGIKREKLTIIPNGVEVPDDLNAVKAKDKGIKKRLGVEGYLLVGNMARLVDFKNHKLLLNAAAKVIRARSDIKVLLIGDGPLREDLEFLSDQLKISDNVLFLGTVVDFEPYLMALDIYVLSSYTESTPMALLHALASGRPVISTIVGDIPLIIQNDESGILVPSDDPDALASAILDLLDDKDKRNRIANAGWKLVKEKFNIQTMLDEVEEIYLEVTQQHMNTGENN